MQYKTIDSKYKEIYFVSRPVEEPDDILRSRADFWMKMTSLAIQNISIQKIKSA
ncbi:hypothetical protein II906_08715 [bacterium]|nr:hypothetical protein [bacterium]